MRASIVESRVFLPAFNQWGNSSPGGEPTQIDTQGALIISGTKFSPYLPIPAWATRIRAVKHRTQSDPVKIAAHFFNASNSSVLDSRIDFVNGIPLPAGAVRFRTWVGYFSDQQGLMLKPGIEIIFTP